MLALPEDALRWERATEELPPGHALGPPVILFRKLEALELFSDGGGDQNATM
jgi:hypothetical protein